MGKELYTNYNKKINKLLNLTKNKFNKFFF